MFSRRALVLLSAAFLSSCAHPPGPQFTVAAAANLTTIFGRMGADFERATGIHVAFSFAATGDLTRQIENAAPFDVFASADMDHIRQLDSAHLLLPGAVRVYARGRLALFGNASSLSDLTDAKIRFISIAKPEAAPYGRAAVEALKNSGLWDQVQPKVVYAENINVSRQYAATGNADAAFTAYSLVLNDHPVLIDPKLYAPIDQGMAILQSSQHLSEARLFLDYVTGPMGQKLLEENGYLKPPLTGR